VLNALPAAAQTEAPNDLPKPIEQCIRDNAPAVERAIDRLPDAVDFLVDDVCAKPIAEQEERDRLASVAKIKESWDKTCAARKSKPKSSAQSDDDFDICAASASSLDYTGGSYMAITGFNKPAGPTALAAQLLLQLRLQRLNATPTQGTH